MLYLPETTIEGFSRTALGICGYCAFVNRNPAYRPVFYDPFAERLFADIAAGGAHLLASLRTWENVLAYNDQMKSARRLLVHVLWRKAFMQRRTLARIAAGAQQVVILGSGLDTLGLRLSVTHPEVPVFEVDQPDTITAKSAAVARNFGVPPQVRYAAVDFTSEPALDPLVEIGYDHTAPTVFIAEVSMEYVPPVDVARVYAMVRGNSAPETVFLTTFADTGAAAARQGVSDSLGASVADAGEPFRFKVAPEAVAGYARAAGFDVAEHYYGAKRLADLFGQIGLDPASLPMPMRVLDTSSLSLAHLRPTPAA